MANTEPQINAEDGWVSLPGPNGQGGVHARLGAVRDGRVVITDLYFHAPEITSSLLRSISIARIEAMGSTPANGGEWDKLADIALGKHRPLTFSELRKRVPKKVTPAPVVPALSRPGGADPETFYRQVAQAYNAAVVTTRGPAKLIADQAGVPVTTVHRWIREARRRGYLPPARKGRAG